VVAAVETLLLRKDPSAISMVDIAEEAGVAATSLYRRWGDVRTLLTDIAVQQLMQEAPMPDTGALKSDLCAWARSIAAGLASPRGSAFFRVYVGAAPRSGVESVGRSQAMIGRIEQIAAMLERAAARGEAAPYVFEVADHILAPLYMRALFGLPASADTADALVEYLLQALASRPKS